MSNSPKEPNDDVINEEEETLDFNRPDFIFLPKGNHSYRQAGPYLVCKSCEIQHAVFIGMEKIMTGVKDNGEPIIRKWAELL